MYRQKLKTFDACLHLDRLVECVASIDPVLPNCPVGTKALRVLSTDLFQRVSLRFVQVVDQPQMINQRGRFAALRQPSYPNRASATGSRPVENAH